MSCETGAAVDGADVVPIIMEVPAHVAAQYDADLTDERVGV